MNSNFGLLEPLAVRVRDKQQRRQRLAERAATSFRQWMEEHDIAPAVLPAAEVQPEVGTTLQDRVIPREVEGSSAPASSAH
ncbi:MAG: hypothetical protein HY703_04215 [Gemmatimonadetes bacterium]|nr:hypothetical protein [Gemmatimonadota bacterium]